MKPIYKEYAKRFFLCAFALFICALGTSLGVKAGSAGTNAWPTLSVGVAGKLGTSFGVANMGIGIIIIVIDFLCKGKIGFGSLMNFVLLSMFADLWLAVLKHFPDPGSQFTGVLCSLLGQTIVSFASVGYMRPALGAGPRDTLLVVIGKKFPRYPIGLVKFAMEMFVLFAGVALGAPFGLGTVLVIALQATIFQFACRVCRFDPRSVKNEDFADTIRRLRA